MIATSLFVIVMVFTFGTVGQNVSFQAKLKTDKEAGVETRKIVDLLARDIKIADGDAKIVVGEGSYVFGGGLALLDCDTGCSLKYNQIPSRPNFEDDADSGANTLVISTKESYRIYVAKRGNSEAIYYKEVLKSKLKEETLPVTEILSIFTDDLRISSNRLESTVTFSGFCPEKNVSKAGQPYVQMLVDARTKGFKELEPRNRAQSIIRTLVTVRNY